MKCAYCDTGRPEVNGFTITYYGDRAYTMNVCERCLVKIVDLSIYTRLRRAAVVCGWTQEGLPMT